MSKDLKDTKDLLEVNYEKMRGKYPFKVGFCIGDEFIKHKGFNIMSLIKVTKAVEISSQKIIGALKRGNGCLKTFAKKSGYTVYFLDEDDNILCPSCAQNALLNLDECAEVVGIDYIKEEPVHCAMCETKIEAKEVIL